MASGILPDAELLVSNDNYSQLSHNDITTEPFEEGAGTSTIHFPRVATAFAAAASILFIVVGVAGNLVTIIALARSLKLRSHATTAFVISLCVSDLLFCTINLPLTASRYIYEEWVLGDVLCRIFPFFFYGNVAASLMNMVAITLNRYILIAHHSIYNRIYRRKNILLMIACLWTFCFGVMVPPLLGIWGTLGLNAPSFSCTILKKDGTSPKKFLFLFGFLVPCIAIIVCYSAIYYKVKQSRMKIASHLNQHNAGSSGVSGTPFPISSKVMQTKKEDMRLTRMMLIIFIGFILTFFPLMIVNVADDQVRVPTLHVMASVLAWASAVINPFVYAFTNRQYRTAYKKLFCSTIPHRAAKTNSHSTPSRTLMTEFQYHASTGVVSNPNLAPTPEE